VSDAAEFLHTLTPAESDALEELGELLGEISGIDRQKRSASVTAKRVA
jgi:hypothetical protein